LGSLIKIVEED